MLKGIIWNQDTLEKLGEAQKLWMNKVNCECEHQHQENDVMQSCTLDENTEEEFIKKQSELKINSEEKMQEIIVRLF